MVSGKILRENIWLARRVTVFAMKQTYYEASVSCFIDYWTGYRLAALSQLFTTLVLVISGQEGMTG